MSIEKICDEIIEASEKATSLPWFKGSWSGRCFEKHPHSRDICNYKYTKDETTSSISVDSENPIELIGYNDNGPVLSHRNANYIVLAVNQAPKLARALKVMEEALRLISEPTTAKGFVAQVDQSTAKEALAEAEKLLGGGE